MERNIPMGTMDEQILRTSKEIIVKYIETGRISPAAFPENFRAVYNTVHETVMEKAGETGQKSSSKKKKAD